MTAKLREALRNVERIIMEENPHAVAAKIWLEEGEIAIEVTSAECLLDAQTLGREVTE